jgi:pSer/pThr/pTyr-binding forkhead associated (FHA) protein
MKPVFIILKGNQVVSKVTVNAGRMLIGRNKDCDIPLDEPAASRAHAVIEEIGDTYYLTDQGSRNGTLVNGQRATGRIALRENDEITIGETRIKFTGAGSRNAGDDDDKTKVWDPKAPTGPGNNGGKVGPGDGNLEYRLVFVEGPSQEVTAENWSGALSLGKAKGNDVVLLDDDLVSGAHAKIIREGDNFFIEDLESLNGVFLNKRKVVKREQLTDGCKVRIGKSVARFEFTDIRQRKRNLFRLLGGVTVVCVAVILFQFLRPPDYVADALARGQGLMKQGKLGDAKNEFEWAFSRAPQNAEAKQLLGEATARIQVQELVAKAQTLSQQGQYEEARNVCDQVLRVKKDNSAANSLKKSLEVILAAEIAAKSRNWPTALAALRNALQETPDSVLLLRRRDHIIGEQKALDSWNEGQRHLGSQNLEGAEQAFRRIPEESVYRPEKQRGLDKVSQLKRYLSALGDATNHFRAGDFASASKSLDAAASANGATDLVAGFRSLLEQIAPLREAMMKAERGREAALSLSDEVQVDALLRLKSDCEALLKVHDDPQNKVVQEAKQLRDWAASSLATLSATFLRKSKELAASNFLGDFSLKPEELLSPENIAKAKLLRQSLEYARYAHKSAPQQPSADDEFKRRKEEFKRVSKILWREASALTRSDFGPEERAKAKPYLMALLEVSREGDDYFDQAKKLIQ